MIKVIIFGAGIGGKNTLKSILDSQLDVDVLCFADNDERLHRTTLKGVPVVNMQESLKLDFDFIYIASSKYFEIYEQLKSNGVNPEKIEICSERVLSGKYANNERNGMFRTNELTKNGKGFCLVTLPKSGTMFTWQNLVNATNKGYPEWLYDEKLVEKSQTGLDYLVEGNCTTGDFVSQKIVDVKQLKHDIDSSTILTFHMPANRHNIECLKSQGVNKLTVLFRDPRDALVSWVHHLNNKLNTRLEEVQKFYFLPDFYSKLTLKEQFSFQIKTYFPLCISWLESWIYYAQLMKGEIDIQIVYFEQMRKFPKEYFESICNFHTDVQLCPELLSSANQGSLHFRKGKSGNWKEEIDHSDFQLMDLIEGKRIETALSKLVKNEINMDEISHQIESNKAIAKESLQFLLNKYTFNELVKEKVIRYINLYIATNAQNNLIKFVNSRSTFDFCPELIEEL